MKTVAFDARFLSALCHDLRGPLGAIGTWVHVLGSDRADGATKSQALAAMARDVAAQGKLLEELSELATLVSGTETAAASRIELVPFVRSVVAATADPSRLRLEVEEPGPIVLADTKALHRLLSLLIGSAVHVGPGSLLELRIGPAARRAEIVVEASGTPRVVTVALVRALAEFLDGTFEVTVTDGRTVLRLDLPSL